MRAPTATVIREWFVNLVVAAFFANFAKNFILHFVETSSISSLLFALIETILVILFLFRRLPRNVSFRIYDWIIAFVGTCMFMVVEPQGSGDTPLGRALMVSGLVLTIAAVISLNLSFGIVAANRGVKRGGLYRVVRHPLYAAYLVIAASVVVNYPSAYNFTIVGIHTVIQILRVLAEERLLLEDSDYQDYAARTRYRLIPFVW
jgi:protein-S-isoprenylcysteine O-methyltransferase Ste14